jgi:hypothetical protein
LTFCEINDGGVGKTLYVCVATVNDHAQDGIMFEVLRNGVALEATKETAVRVQHH